MGLLVPGNDMPRDFVLCVFYGECCIFISKTSFFLIYLHQKHFFF